MATRELPMFPLGTVLLPGTALPLHVFEPRYRALTGWCLEHDGRFGIVLIERGSEVGGGDTRFAVGTVARIIESVALPDGRWVLAAVGERRLRVDRWLGEEPFPRAEVALLDDVGMEGLGRRARDKAVDRLYKALALRARLGELPEGDAAPHIADDAAQAVWQVAAHAMLSPVDTQRLLETDDVGVRLDLLTALLDEEIDVLALRASGG